MLKITDAKINSSFQVNCSDVLGEPPIKPQMVPFGANSRNDEYTPKEINYERLSLLISQKVPMKKMNKFYNEMIESPYDTFYGKVSTLKTKMIMSIKRKVDPETADKNILDGCAQAIGMLIPNRLKIDRDDKTFDIPYQVNASIINIMNSVDNYEDFYGALDLYTGYMDKYRYNVDSDLPTVVGVKAKGDYITLEFDKDLSRQKV